jgi:hypothetical protein
MNAVDISAWSANWAWGLALIVLNVVIHVIGLALIYERVVHVLSGLWSSQQGSDAYYHHESWREAAMHRSQQPKDRFVAEPSSHCDPSKLLEG